MEIREIKEASSPLGDLARLLQRLHEEGPSTESILEELSYYKEFHPDAFIELEEKIIYAIGLFYKVGTPTDVYSFLMAQIGDDHKRSFGAKLTPVQASLHRALEANQFISISAPTSAGKSYSIRKFIADDEGDAVVVVPSRALIAEYVSAMRASFHNDKNVMILPFVDRVFTRRKLRRIFIVTPERSRDLFDLSKELNVKVFFFDEAQVSEEIERGVVFDVMVRRIRNKFPLAKLIFAHPFVENPDAQFKKHNINSLQSFSQSYTQGSVGKLHIFRHENGKDYYFSPYHSDGHLIKNSVEYPGDFSAFAFGNGHAILVYVSKTSIYNGSFIDDFREYIDYFDELQDAAAKEIISSIEHLVGADERSHRSEMVSLLKKGVVIHHGSVPLEVRYLIESFIRKGFARVCFATSTLVQGVNMPFDVVWLSSMRMLADGEGGKSLALKNLIGRAGRLSNRECFDYGYVFTKNPKLLSERLRDGFILSDESSIDSDDESSTHGGSELIDAIREGTFNDRLNVPQSKAERLSSPSVMVAISGVLDIVYASGALHQDSLRGEKNKEKRKLIEGGLRVVYEASLARPLLDGERAVFAEAISLMLLAFQGRSFREIVGVRYSRITKRDKGREGKAAFSQQAAKLPDSNLMKPYPLFKDTEAKIVSYDKVVFDTYDYLDQVVSFSLSDDFIAAFTIYFDLTGDVRANKFIELVRFGTNDKIHVLLMRYGFLPEDLIDIRPYVEHISEEGIEFRDDITLAGSRLEQITSWYR